MPPDACLLPLTQVMSRASLLIPRCPQVHSFLERAGLLIPTLLPQLCLSFQQIPVPDQQPQHVGHHPAWNPE